jgi:hypothetical protein
MRSAAKGASWRGGVVASSARAEAIGFASRRWQ